MAYVLIRLCTEEHCAVP